MKNWISTVHTMLNVVFIMLIFFIVTVSFIKKPGIGINRSANNISNELPQNNIFINVSSVQGMQTDSRLLSTAAVTATIVRLKAESLESSVVI